LAKKVNKNAIFYLKLVKEKLHMDDYLQNQEIKGDCNKTLGIK
jgi:hypothetical protein